MDGFAARCERLVELLREEAPSAEEQRRLSDRVIAAAHEEDLFRSVVPSSLGGLAEPLDELLGGTRILAHGDVASAWTLSFLVMHSWLMSKFPAAGVAEIFAAHPAPLAPAPLAPTGSITSTDDGVVLNGSWEWATGVNHAEWVMVHAIQSEPKFAMKFCVVPIGEVRVDDVWFTAGMRATGSNTVRADDVFVPDHRTLDARAFLDSTVVVDGDGLANLPVPPVLALLAAAPALGGAEWAVDLYEERLRTRVLAYSLGDKATEQPAAQIRLAKARSDLRQARDHFDATVARLMAAADLGEVSMGVRVDTRLAAAAVVASARSVVSTVCEGAGASVYRSDHPLQRIQRDLETLKGHVIFDWDRTAELAGRVALGFDLRPADMV